MQWSFDSFGAFAVSIPVPCPGVSGCHLPVCPLSPVYVVGLNGPVLWTLFPACLLGHVLDSPFSSSPDSHLCHHVLRPSALFLLLFRISVLPCSVEDSTVILRFYAALFILVFLFKGFPQMPDDLSFFTSKALKCRRRVPALSLSGTLQTLPAGESA